LVHVTEAMQSLSSVSQVTIQKICLLIKAADILLEFLFDCEVNFTGV